MEANLAVKFVYACTKNILNLEYTLASGQSFRWNQNKDGAWIGVIRNQVWHLTQKDDGHISCEVHGATCSQTKNRMPSAKRGKKSRKRPRLEPILDDVNDSANAKLDHNGSEVPTNLNMSGDDSLPTASHLQSILKDYFQLDVDLEALYENWEKVDENFKSKASKFIGIRIMRQDPLENLFSFICSSNNNIPRIKSMVEKLCCHYGTKIVEINGQSYYTFPTLKVLSAPEVEANLRQLGFGYRAKFINKCAQYILTNHNSEWLNELRKVPYEEAHSKLKQLPGVGAKVADCVCLMSLDKPQAIPVDTHVWQIATQKYLPHLKSAKSLTDKIYKEVGDFFRQRFGEYAGWAHSVLFCAELKPFEDGKS